MSNFQFRFTIEEAPDAKSFLFFDTTGEYDAVANPTGWGSETILPSAINSAYFIFKKIAEFPEDSYEVNYSIITDKLNSSSPIEYEVKDLEQFKDGAYKVQVFFNFGENAEKVNEREFGFLAIIKNRVMKESLSYRPERTRVYREMIWEKLRLLDNLYYSTETNQIQHFRENLRQLEKLK